MEDEDDGSSIERDHCRKVDSAKQCLLSTLNMSEYKLKYCSNLIRSKDYKRVLTLM